MIARNKSTGKSASLPVYECEDPAAVIALLKGAIEVQQREEAAGQDGNPNKGAAACPSS